MKIAIIDDNQSYIDDLQRKIEKYEEETHEYFTVHGFTDVQQFMEYFYVHLYDLIYLDMEVDGENGVDLARRIKEIKPNCIIMFVAGYIHHFQQSFIVNAFQFFLKSDNDDEFFQSELARAVKYYKSYNKLLILSTDKGYRSVGMNDIIYFETSYNEYSVHTIHGSLYGQLKSAKDIKNQLMDRYFYRIQRSYIINFLHIQSIEGFFVTMDNGISLPISRKCIKDFKNSYFQFVENY